MYSREDRVISVFSLQPIEIKDDTLPFKRQALAWENETKPWIQGFQTLDFFLASSFCSIYHNSVHFECGIIFFKD